jgi:hypothetical protein
MFCHRFVTDLPQRVFSAFLQAFDSKYHFPASKKRLLYFNKLLDYSGKMNTSAPVAQPDRVVASEAIGRGFESLRARQFSL